MVLSSASALMQGEYREARVDRRLKDSWTLGEMLITCGKRAVIDVKAMWKAGRAGAGGSTRKTSYVD